MIQEKQCMGCSPDEDSVNWAIDFEEMCSDCNVCLSVTQRSSTRGRLQRRCNASLESIPLPTGKTICKQTTPSTTDVYVAHYSR